MAGNIFSGHYGRRSSGSYLDQMPRLLAAQAASSLCKAESCSLFVPFDGLVHHVAVLQVRIGAMNQYRFVCKQCGRRCRILYLSTLPRCRRCTGAHYRSQSESSAARLQRRAYKILKTVKFDSMDAQQKMPGRHWSTHLRALQAAERAIGIIVKRNDRIMALLSRNQLIGNVKTKA
jgi:hypothetical protein